MTETKTSTTEDLIVESPVYILPEQRLSHSWKCIDLQQPQALLESVVDFNLALTTHNHNTTRTVS